MVYNGQAVQYTITATVGMNHPSSGEPTVLEMTSGGIGEGHKDRFTTSFAVGDVVTVVHLPEDPEGSLRLYGFLGLNPDIGLVPKPGVEPARPFTLALTVVGVVALFTALFWNVYAFQRFQPIEPDYDAATIPMALGGLLLGGGFLVATLVGHRRERRRQEEANRQAAMDGRPLEYGASSFWGQQGWWARVLAVIVIAGALGLGAVTALVWAWSANALFDGGVAEEVGAQVIRVEVTTESYVFRSYVVVYRLPGSREEIEYSATSDELERFTDRPAVAEVMPGRFGWPWVRRLRPASGEGGAGSMIRPLRASPG